MPSSFWRLDTAGAAWKAGASLEEMPPPERLVGTSLRLRSVGVAFAALGLGAVRKHTSQATRSSSPPWPLVLP